MTVTISKKEYTSTKHKKMKEEFIPNFIKGDTSTLDWVYQNYGPSVYGHVMKNGGDDSQAADVFQITMIAVRNNLLAGKYNEQFKFKHYFVKIAMNTWRNEQKRLRKVKARHLDDYAYSIVDDSEATLETKIVKDEKISLLERAMNMLDTMCKELIRRHYYENEKLKDIAEEKETTAGNIRIKLMRCRERIKKLMG